MQLTNLANARRDFPPLIRRVLAAESSSYDEWFYRYCGELASEQDAHRYLTYHADTLALAGVDPAGKAVLDAGCGFGTTLLAYATLGGASLHGIDMHAGMIATINAYQDLLPGELRERLHVRHGDVSALPYDDRSFDIVLSIEAISHYLEVDSFLREAARVLRPGGTLIVSDGNNGANPLVRRKTQEIWNVFENGPNDSSVHGHPLTVCYRDRRREVIERAFPQLDTEDARKLADRTFAMTADQVLQAARSFVDDGSLPSSPFRPGVVPADPDGAVNERLFDPMQLASDIAAHGFKARAYGYWGGSAGRRVVRLANQVLTAASPLTIRTAPSFRIVATRGT